MQKNDYGYIGGGNLIHIGTRDFVQSFFLAVEKYVFKEKLYRQLDWSLITDRLYKRTVPHDQLDSLIGMINRIMFVMQQIPISFIDWQILGLNNPQEFDKNYHNGNLADIYDKFRIGLVHCTFGVKIGYLIDTSCDYPPLRIGNLHHFIHEEDRPPEAYEALGPNDLPFWLRDDIVYPEVNRTPVKGVGGIGTFIDYIPPGKA